MFADHSEKTEPPREIGSLLSLSRPRRWLLGLSVVSLLICAIGGALHYAKWAWGNPWQVVGWLFSMLFLLLALAPRPKEIVRRLGAVEGWKTAFFALWILFFTISHLWNFRTAPWNGDALFDESGWDLFFLKDYVIGHPYQAAWFHPPLSRETLFHYYVWAFLRAFGFNILSYEAALFFIWLATFVFTLLLIDLLFDSKIVTSLAGLIFNFLPFAYVYTFAGYRYPMGTAFCIASLYFVHLGFKKASSFALALGGILAGLCVASSITGKQYIFVLLLFGIAYGVIHWRGITSNLIWAALVILYGCIAAGMPILCYIAFTWEHYTLYEKGLVSESLKAGLGYRARQLWECFFKIPGARFFIPDALPIPIPYYGFLLPGLFLALWRKRFEIVLLAIVPVIGAFLATAWDNRLLLPMPFWIILMAFTFAALLRVKLPPPIKSVLWIIALVAAGAGLVPSVRFINNHGKDRFSIVLFAQEEVAVSRFLKEVVAGKQPKNPPRRERDEFNRIPGLPEPPYDTLICQERAYSILHLFLHDYDHAKVLSFCGDLPFYPQTEQQVWTANKSAILRHSSKGKDLKLIWERNPKVERIIKLFEPLRDIGREESLTEFFAGRGRLFYVLTFEGKNIIQLQERVFAMPDTLP